MELQDKIAVVTGGASGIGRSTCELMAEQGAKAIAVVDIGESVNTFCSNWNREHKREVMMPFRGDVVDSNFREQVFQEMERKCGPVSICIPAAGITRDKLSVKVHNKNGKSTVEIYPEEDFRRVLDIDLTAPIYWSLRSVASVALDRARRNMGRWEPEERVQGCIVLVGSVSSAGNRGQISYATAKAGLEGAQATLAAEAIYYGIRCAIIHPGFTDTPLVRSMGEEIIKTKVLPNTQLRRLIRPQEIASAIVFMIINSAISGALWADAGWHPSA
jgi:NAD(P)-dependent dehydrogenase (short-subunit alcohol dehydrogenase family)